MTIGLHDADGRPLGPHGPLTDEQARAALCRDGRLLIRANAGAGKTMVLVERFVRDVLDTRDDEQPIRCADILAITFTRKAAGELRARVRSRFLELGHRAEARDVEQAWISTIDGFCARVLRANAVAAGLDPGFSVLEPPAAREVHEQAFAEALDGWLGDPTPPAGALELLAALGYDGLFDAVRQIFESLRSAGHEHPRIPIPAPPDVDAAERALREAVGAALGELGDGPPPGKAVARARAGLEDALAQLGSGARPGAATLKCWRPQRTAGALKTVVFDDCRVAFDAYAQALDDEHARPRLQLVARLLEAFDAAVGRAKGARHALDFTDLALHTRDLLLAQPAVAAAYRARLRRVMVDEFQDTNQLQLELLDALGIGDVFLVGDALQSIYGFRHADVEVFQRQLRRHEARDAAGTLAANFRSEPAILDLVNAALGDVHEDAEYVPLVAGLTASASATAGPCVELLLTDIPGWRAADPELLERVVAGLPAGTRPEIAAEALLVAQRVRELVDGGAATPAEIVVLVRAGSNLPVLERAIERTGLAAVAAQGRGWWGRLEVLDLIAHLRVLANPEDEEALFAALVAFAGVGRDTLALLAMERDRARRAGDAGSRAWGAMERAVAGAPDGLLAAIEPAEIERLRGYAALLDRERAAAAWAGPGELLRRVVRESAYDVTALERPGGARRLANVRKLVRLAHEFEAGPGRTCARSSTTPRPSSRPAHRRPDAPVDIGADPAVRLMTIHAAKGLEFPVVIVADLGHEPAGRAPRVLVDGGAAGLRLTTIDRHKISAFDYERLKGERMRRDRAEERRVIHVAVTRAQRRLILSGTADLEPSGWDVDGKQVPALRWMLPRLLRGAALERLGALVREDLVIERPPFRARLQVAVNAPRTLGAVLVLDAAGVPAPGAGGPAPGPVPAPEAAAAPLAPPAPATVSYSALSDYAACPYRWYLRRVLRLPARDTWDLDEVIPPRLGADARLRGTIAHVLLEGQDFGPAAAVPEPAQVAGVAAACGAELDDAQVADQQALVGAALGGPLRARLAGAQRLGREVAFALALEPGAADAPMLIGSIDVLAREASGAALVVDWKTDRMGPDADLAAHVEADYRLQRLAYALAALRDGATSRRGRARVSRAAGRAGERRVRRGRGARARHRAARGGRRAARGALSGHRRALGGAVCRVPGPRRPVLVARRAHRRTPSRPRTLGGGLRVGSGPAGRAPAPQLAVELGSVEEREREQVQPQEQDDRGRERPVERTVVREVRDVVRECERGDDPQPDGRQRAGRDEVPAPRGLRRGEAQHDADGDRRQRERTRPADEVPCAGDVDAEPEQVHDVLSPVVPR